ncbi:MAG TPA: SDR family oxidoreductase [Dongiaceae bacterium]|nr:SDR family oxidoreductase [Dongiaceae bacterium]
MLDSNPFDLSQDVAIVTGASSGLGWHFAKTLVAAGARVALVARRHERLEELVGELPAGSATAIAANIAERSTIVDLVATVTRELSAPTLLINNAGIADDQAALDLTEADWHGVLDTNLTGAWELAQLCATAWVAEKRPGNIINIASILGLRVAGRSLPYAVSKAGLIQMTKALSLEWARYQIRVNAIAPGYIETDLNRDFFASDAGAALIKRIPQRRLGAPADLDGALLLLASQASSYMTGSVITVDGGHLNSSL